MSFGGKRHSGNVAIRPGDGARGERLVLSVWRNGVVAGDGDTQRVVIDRDIASSVLRALTCAMGLIEESDNDNREEGGPE